MLLSHPKEIMYEIVGGTCTIAQGARLCDDLDGGTGEGGRDVHE